MIYDTDGRLHKHKTSIENIVNIKDLENGLYIIRIYDEKQSQVFRFLKSV